MMMFAETKNILTRPVHFIKLQGLSTDRIARLTDLAHNSMTLTLKSASVLRVVLFKRWYYINLDQYLTTVQVSKECIHGLRRYGSLKKLQPKHPMRTNQ